MDKNKNTEVFRLGIFILTQRLLDAREDVLELVQPRLLVLLDNLLIIIDDLDLILRQEADRRIHIVTHGAAMELRGDDALCLFARDEVDELLRILHVLCILDDIDAVRL